MNHCDVKWRKLDSKLAISGSRLLIPFLPPLSLALFLTHALLFPFRPYFNLLLFLEAWWLHSESPDLFPTTTIS